MSPAGPCGGFISIDPEAGGSLDWSGMARKSRYLAASLLSFAKPFLIGTIAVSAGLDDSGAFALSFLRFLVFPHLVPAICLMFIYLDEKTYRHFKPLALLVNGGSLLALFLNLRTITADPQALALTAGSTASISMTIIALGATILIDIFCLAVFIPFGSGRREGAPMPETTLPEKEL